MRRPHAHEWAVLDEDSDPIPGDPDLIALLGQSLREVADDIRREAGDIEALSGVESWKGKAADKFRETAEETIKPLRMSYHRYNKAAEAMGERVRPESTADWASALEHAQQLAEKALKAGQAAHEAHQSAVKALNKLPNRASDNDPDRVRLERKRDEAASDLQDAKSDLQHAKEVRDRAAEKAARVINRAITHDGMHDKAGDKFGEMAGDVAGALSDAGDFLEEMVIDGTLSVANAMLDNPASVVEMAAGVAMVLTGAGAEVGGVVLDCTGVGAVIGVPVNIAAAGVIAGGLAAIGHGGYNIAKDAAGPSRVNMHSQGAGGGGSGKWNTAAENNRTKPSSDPDPNHQPRGKPEPVSKDADPTTVRAFGRERHSADTLAKAGYDVEQRPPTLPNGKNPDFSIEGRVFDNYAPTSKNPRNIWGEIQKKVDKGQTERVVLNLGDSNVDLGALRAQFSDWPISKLKEVTVIDRAGNIVHLYP